MENSEINIKERQYYIDWLRITLILSVFIFHVGMIFNTWDWHVKNDITYGWLKGIMSFLHLWRIPLLFMVSGAGTWFALGFRSRMEYLSERSRRLLIPAIAGIILLVPVQVYLDTNLSARMSQYRSLADFYPHFFDGIYPEGNFSWHHLYFIVYLFLIALVVTPFLNFLRSDSFSRFFSPVAKIMTRPIGINLFLVPLILSQAILRPLFPEETHALINDWAWFVYFLLFFIAGFLFLSKKEIVETICKNRIYYLVQSALTASLLLIVPELSGDEFLSGWLWNLNSIIVTWSVCISVIGFARKYLNLNTSFRKIANEAIFPFYLLHQPAIVVTGYYIVKLGISPLLKFLLITSGSLLLTISAYLLIRRFNILRLMFGLKQKRKSPELMQPGSVSRVVVNQTTYKNIF